MSTDAIASATAVNDDPAPTSAPVAATGASSAAERPKAANTVANTANQILFKNELYTSMKQKTMDHELMAKLTKEAHEEEERKFANAKAAVARLDKKQKVLIGVGDMLGPPGSDPETYSSASIAVTLEPFDTVREVKKKLIAAARWSDELPSDFGLFDDFSEEPLKDGQLIEAALAPVKPSSAGKAARRGGSRTAAPIRVPRPYVGVLWAARVT